MDWEFKIVYDDDINLSHSQQKKYKELRGKISRSAGKIAMQARDKKFNLTSVNFFKTVPQCNDQNISREDVIRFVKYGKSNIHSKTFG